ncbi:hypothetical protein L2X99_02855 [Microbacterium sp. KUDC0406]|uniref:hypothetical protein n=1 Tax=Microbacterium sp. KUDC0406 TaxID=2909588 RepID=UPI001F2C00C5|nr:hypothetical protein [Microbacterium sp. KUDC0406]UJP10630.1 hypothetical protein L2X99_02855 [Microbacterium sp. KUDC0406]
MKYPGESWQTENIRRDLAAAQERQRAEAAEAERQRAARIRAAETRATPVLVAAEHTIRPEPAPAAPAPEPPRSRRWRYENPASFYSVAVEEEPHAHDQ